MAELTNYLQKQIDLILKSGYYQEDFFPEIEAKGTKEAEGVPEIGETGGGVHHKKMASPHHLAIY